MAYDANSVKTLSFKEAVQTKISMYMGSADNMGVLQCIREIISNSLKLFSESSKEKIFFESALIE